MTVFDVVRTRGDVVSCGTYSFVYLAACRINPALSSQCLGPNLRSTKTSVSFPIFFAHHHSVSFPFFLFFLPIPYSSIIPYASGFVLTSIRSMDLVVKIKIDSVSKGKRSSDRLGRDCVSNEQTLNSAARKGEEGRKRIRSN